MLKNTTEDITVTITAEEFRTSVYYDFRNCALAKALKRMGYEIPFGVGPDFVIDKAGNFWRFYNGNEIQNRCGNPEGHPLTVTLESPYKEIEQ